MTDTDTRFRLALAHLRTISEELADDVAEKTALWSAADKDRLSLAGGAYYRKGDTAQHVAVRALVLCTLCYMRPPHTRMEFASDAVLKEIRNSMEGKPQAFVDAEIRLYLRSEQRSKDRLAQAALDVCMPVGNVLAYSRKRTDTNLGSGPVCYNGTSTWLFAAGFVSRRWLAREGSQMLDTTSREYLGSGALIGGRDQWHTIPRGHIFYIHKTGDQNTCHWGVSLGEGRAVACNNTIQAPERTDDGTIVRHAPLPGKARGIPKETTLQFENDGNATYGIFQMAELCDILNRTSKYMVGTYVGDKISGEYVESNSPTGCNIVVRHIDPTAAVGWY